MYTKLQNYQIIFDNSEEFHGLKQEIYTQHTYYFETDSAAPVIIDAGAHIGLATLYFKKLYPAAQISAIEPHPGNFKLLKKNIEQNFLENVTPHQLALSTQTGTTHLYFDETPDQWWSTASFTPGAWNGIQQSTSLEVETRPLADFLTQPVDFMKMDIEGAEQAVMIAAGDKLRLVKHFILEFHPLPENSLTKLVDFLEQQDFHLHIWKKGQEVKVSQASGLVHVEGTK